LFQILQERDPEKFNLEKREEYNGDSMDKKTIKMFDPHHDSSQTKINEPLLALINEFQSLMNSQRS
jgi:hypothetical protein